MELKNAEDSYEYNPPFLGKSTFANSFCAVLQGRVIAKSCVWQVTVRDAQLNTLLWTFQRSEK
jgi:hypothetical protein